MASSAYQKRNVRGTVLIGLTANVWRAESKVFIGRTVPEVSVLKVL
jgi:hypothetical protein